MIARAGRWHTELTRANPSVRFGAQRAPMTQIKLPVRAR